MADLLYAMQDGVATLTLHRPDRLNAITFAMLEELGRQLREADADPAVRCVILTGENAPLAIRAMKRLYRHGLSQDFESHSHHVLMQLMQLFRSEDFREGIASFAERRPPRFQGR